MRLFPLKRTRALRTLAFLTGDLAVWTFAVCASFLIRYDGAIAPSDWRKISSLLAILIPPKLLGHAWFRLYRMTWRLVGLSDVMNVWKANTLGSVLGFAVLLVLPHVQHIGGPSHGILLLDYVLSVGGIAVFRIARRLWAFERNRRRHGREARRILLVGAGAAGERLVRAMTDEVHSGYDPVGFVDDDPSKHGTDLHGIPVLGGRASIAKVVRDYRVTEVVIAIPSASSAQLRGIVEAIRQSGVRQIRILPGVHELLTARVRLQDIREVNVDDLLGRAPVQIRMEAIGAALAGRRVLVTGAAGSIGAQMVRQLTRFPCAEIAAVDTNETGLFDLEESVRTLETSVPVRTMVADIRDREKVQWLMHTYRPEIVFHAAAYKHVPLMERHVDEAVRTNVLGTFVLAEAAVRSGVQTFVLVSTDKAVNPASVLGLTKRVAERVVQVFSQRRRTRFFAVRFGNVLGSRGSLIPLLQEQIRKGGPITLTHPDMRRYFMSVTEAVLLVLQSVLMDRQTGIFVLDMGEPVRIVDLATELVRLSGLDPDRDVPIVFTGARPGEKMEEELAQSDETLLATPFEKIFEVQTNGLPAEAHVRLALQELEQMARAVDGDGMRELLAHLANGGPQRYQGTTAAVE